MTLTVVILLLGGAFFASLLAIGLRSELDRDHPWRAFADRHGLTYRATDGEHRIEGSWQGRELRASVESDGSGDPLMRVAVPLELDGAPDATIRRSASASEEEGSDTSEVVELEEGSSVRVDVVGGDGASRFLRHSEDGARLLELQRAEPRLAYVDHRLQYRSHTVLRNRKKLGELLDRMVDSARYVEGAL